MTNKLPNWLNAKGHQNDIVISSRVRLARNIDDYMFPRNMTRLEKEKLLESLKDTIETPEFNQELGKMTLIRLEEATPIERQYLLEKHLISPDMLENYPSTGIVLGLDESISILVNEEDHLRIQSFFSGLNLEDAYIIADKVDDVLEKFYQYSYHEQYGYLTSCPTNVGTGIRFSVMMHLPALAMNAGLEKISQGLKKEGFVIRGFFGEGSKAYGDLYQISNQFTIGVKETEIMLSLNSKINDIIELEKESRSKLFLEQELHIKDMIYRAYGNLKYALILSAKEGMNDISLLRLGLERGMKFDQELNYQQLNSLIVLAQPAGLQKYFAKTMEPEERDGKRPQLFQEILKIGGDK